MSRILYRAKSPSGAVAGAMPKLPPFLMVHGEKPLMDMLQADVLQQAT